MRVVLSVESGRLAGRRVWLRENQRLSVGRNEWAEFSVRDSSLSDVHFALDTAARKCRLTNASSEASTFVNGEAVQVSILKSGDVVLAGKTHFRVELEQDDCEPTPAVRRPPRDLCHADSSEDLSVGGSTNGNFPDRGLPDRETVCKYQDDTANVPVTPNTDEPPSANPSRDIRRRQEIRMDDLAGMPRLAAAAPTQGEALRGKRHDKSTVSADGSFLAVLQIDSGCHAGRKVWLRDSELMRFGRTEVADQVLPGDDRMSGLHFAVCTKSKQCWIYDLNSLNGLFVNEKKVERLQLRDGDIVRAGRTLFRVTLEGVSASEQPQRPAGSNAGGVGGETVTGLKYLRSECNSGLVKYDGLPDGETIDEVARLLCQRWPMYLIVNYRRAGLAEPAELAATSNLFRGASGLSSESNSLLLLSQSDDVDLLQVLQDASGKATAIAIFSDLTKAELVERLSPSAASFSATGIIARQLSDAPLVYVRQLLGNINATLISGRPHPWSVFADPAIISGWQDLGFPVAPADA